MTLAIGDHRRSPSGSSDAFVKITAELKTGSPIPIYYQLAQAITRSIQDGKIASGMTLEPNHAIARSLGVSLNTVRRAFQLLGEKAILHREVIGNRTIVVRCQPCTEQTSHQQPINRHPPWRTQGAPLCWQ